MPKTERGDNVSNLICYDADGALLKELYQWDCNQELHISGLATSPVPSIHFCNRLMDKAMVVSATVSDGKIVANIPNILLTQAETIYAFVYNATGDDGHRTTYTIRIPVYPRQIPEDYTMEDNVDYADWVALSEQATTLFATLQANAEAATQAASDAATAANNAAAAANAASAAIGTISEIDGLLFRDEDDEVSFIGKFRVVDGHPALRCTQVSS